MQHQFVVYNTLSRKKEVFEPLHAPFVGMYVCGPTVYGEAHLGNARPAVTFDVLKRYLLFKEYKVRYVRNITDVGHLENDADEGEDKIGKLAKAQKLEPMEVAQYYTNRYRINMNLLNILPPDIEPTATGHMIEQIEMIKEIMDNGLAYEVNGSVYFDVPAYNKNQRYGKLSGRVIEELLSNTRDLEGQQEKRSPLDFALWKKASDAHIMRWPSPWSDGFPGWHLECSAMSRKYLGQTFDIHGGGLDLMFPHHECEIAQSQASSHVDPAKYWMHVNMLTVNGQKMGKSLGNFITVADLFEGKHTMFPEPFSPMTLRFFFLQAHYRSTLDVSYDALVAARKGYFKMLNGLHVIGKLTYPATSDQTQNAEEEEAAIQKLMDDTLRAMDDDLNTAKAIGSLFNLLKKFNSMHSGSLPISAISEQTFNQTKDFFRKMVVEVLGLKEERSENLDAMLELVLNFYKEAKDKRDYDKVDQIRAGLKKQGIVVKDTKAGIEWAYEEV